MKKFVFFSAAILVIGSAYYFFFLKKNGNIKTNPELASQAKETSSFLASEMKDSSKVNQPTNEPIKKFSEYKLKDVLEFDSITLTKDDVERALNSAGRTPLHLLAAGILLNNFKKDFSGQPGKEYIEESFSKEKNRSSYLAILGIEKERSDALISEFKKLDPDNLIGDILSINNDYKRAVHLDAKKIEEVFKKKKIIGSDDSLALATKILLEALGFEKEASEYLASMTEFMELAQFNMIPQYWTYGFESDKNSYSNAEKIKILKSINELNKVQPSFLNIIIEISTDIKIAKLEKDKKKLEKLERKEDCLMSLKTKFNEIQNDLSYNEAEEWFKTSKVKGEFAAFKNTHEAQQVLEYEGCSQYFK
jgi:hypothetical protein